MISQQEAGGADYLHEQHQPDMGVVETAPEQHRSEDGGNDHQAAPWSGCPSAEVGFGTVVWDHLAELHDLQATDEARPPSERHQTGDDRQDGAEKRQMGETLKKVKCGVTVPPARTSMWLTLVSHDHPRQYLPCEGPQAPLGQNRNFLMCLYRFINASNNDALLSKCRPAAASAVWRLCSPTVSTASRPCSRAWPPTRACCAADSSPNSSCHRIPAPVAVHGGRASIPASTDSTLAL